MATLTLTKGMDQVINIELTTEIGLLEVFVGTLTSSDFRVVSSPKDIVNVIKIAGTPGSATLVNGVLSLPIVEADLAAVAAGKYFGQWSGIVNSKPLVSELFTVVVEPKVGI